MHMIYYENYGLKFIILTIMTEYVLKTKNNHVNVSHRLFLILPLQR